MIKVMIVARFTSVLYLIRLGLVKFKMPWKPNKVTRAHTRADPIDLCIKFHPM